MKIGVVVDNDLNNDKRVLREIQILHDAGHEVFVLCFGFRKEYKNPIEGIHIKRIRIRKKIKDILFFLQNSIALYDRIWAIAVSRFIKENNCEVIHTHDLYMSRAVHAGIARSGINIHLILDLHEYYPYSVRELNWTKGFFRSLISKPRKWEKKEREYLNYAEGLIVLSDEFRDTLTKKYPELERKKFIAFPNVPDLKSIKQVSSSVPSLPFDKDAFVLFYFGVVAERRGIFDLLEVFTGLTNEYPGIALLIVGPVDKADRERFDLMISNPAVKSKVCWLPWIDLTELPGYLAAISVGIAPFKKNPQHESGVANKIYDYMSGKKPLIVSDCKPQRNLVEKHNCGIAYTTNEELKHSIIRLASDRELCLQMGNNGYNAIVSEYNTDKTKEILLNFYSELI
jgi:glycosyltransferase involved in cell wall biosynthesis